MQPVNKAWSWIEGRLDRRWKRIAFILWGPLAIATVVASAYAFLHIYIVYVASDVLGCHRDLAGYEELSANTILNQLGISPDTPWASLDVQTREKVLGAGRNSSTNQMALRIAHQRSDTLLSRLSSETMAIESSPEFINCMSKDFNYGTYWQNYSVVMRYMAVLVFCTVIVALICMTSIWRTIGRAISNWVKMKS
jgi:hypothetical protein